MFLLHILPPNLTENLYDPLGGRTNRTFTSLAAQLTKESDFMTKPTLIKQQEISHFFF